MSVKKLPTFISNSYELVPKKQQPDPTEFLEYVNNLFKQPVRVSEWKGYLMFPGFEREASKYCYEKFLPNSGDIIIAAYGQTGTHWLLELVRQILFHNNPEKLRETQKLSGFFTHLEYGPVSKYKVLENVTLERRCLSTHLPAALFNFEKFRKKGAKILYVVRNPKDQAVAWCKFILSFDNIGNTPLNKRYPKDEKLFYDSYISGEQQTFAKPGEGYLEHVRGWYEHRNDPNVMILTYEEIKQNIGEHIREIADFINCDVNDNDVLKIAQGMSLPFSKGKIEHGNISLVSKMLFKNEIGSWRKHLSKEQSDEIDKKVEEVLGDTDIKFVYDIKRNQDDLRNKL